MTSASLRALGFLTATLRLALASVPPWQSTYVLNASTIIMPCSYTGLTAPASVAGWGITDFDWSNALAVWSADVPMDTEERLLEQVRMSTAANPEQKVWVYRNSVYGYPWYTAVRKILDNPLYSPWFIKFKPLGPWTSPKCDHFHSPPLCTDYFHTQMDTPTPDGHGYGKCAPPACNCGTKPCGFYVFNHSSSAVINGQTFRQFFIDSYMLNDVGMDPSISGFFWDDFVDGNMGDNTVNATADMGLTPADLLQLTADYEATMAELRARTLAAGKFSWQMLWTGGAPGDKGSTCPQTIVRAPPAECAADLARLCAPGAPPQSQAMMYAFSPGGCGGDPSSLPTAGNDVANFLLIRGDYAWIGHGWKSCSKTYEFPTVLNTDVGTPLGLCAETAPGVFARNYSKVYVQMDCNKGVSSIVPRA